MTRNSDDARPIVVVGNSSIADYILELLNVTHPDTGGQWNPMLVSHGYPIRLRQRPGSVTFIFIINEDQLPGNQANHSNEADETEQANPVALALLDRLVHFYLTWNTYNDAIQAELERNRNEPGMDEDVGSSVIASYLGKADTRRAVQVSDVDILRNSITEATTLLNVRPGSLKTVFEKFETYCVDGEHLIDTSIGGTTRRYAVILTKTSTYEDLGFETYNAGGAKTLSFTFDGVELDPIVLFDSDLQGRVDLNARLAQYTPS
jgi:hypothetical protein